MNKPILNRVASAMETIDRLEGGGRLTPAIAGKARQALSAITTSVTRHRQHPDSSLARLLEAIEGGQISDIIRELGFLRVGRHPSLLDEGVDEGVQASATSDTMTVSELIEQLRQHDPSQPVYLFAEGNDYPVLEVQFWADGGDTYVEVAGGWMPKEF